MTKANKIFAILPAAGVGKRAGGSIPKQYQLLLGKSLIEHTLSRFLELPFIEKIIVVVAAQDDYWPALAIAENPKIKTVIGGAERCDSVLNGLNYLSSFVTENDWVLVHDVARPCVETEDVKRLIKQAVDTQGALLATPVSDTIKQSSAGENVSLTTLDRSVLWQAQTPQYFPVLALKQALEKSLSECITITDEASAMEYIGVKPLLVASSRNNIKVTCPEDFALAEFILSQQSSNKL